MIFDHFLIDYIKKVGLNFFGFLLVTYNISANFQFALVLKFRYSEKATKIENKLSNDKKYWDIFPKFCGPFRISELHMKISWDKIEKESFKTFKR